MVKAIIAALFFAGVGFADELVRIDPRPKAAQHKCVACGFDCQCQACKCPQATKGVVREETDSIADFDRERAARNGYLAAGTKFQQGGWWYTADGRGGGTYCVECNGMTLSEALAWWNRNQTRYVPTLTRAVYMGPVYYGGACASGNCSPGR